MQPVLRHALINHRVVAGVEHKPVLNSALMTVIDIGANRGQFALAARTISGARVISFEPLKQAAEIFEGVFADDPAVSLHQVAIGDESGEKLIHLSAHDHSSSLLEIGERQSAVFPGTHEVGTRVVRVGTLDEFISHKDIVSPAMLKLDVQGFELQALKGCKSLIDRFDFIYCECSFVELYKHQKLAHEVIDYLHAFGFNLAGVYNPQYDPGGNCIQSDLLFRLTKGQAPNLGLTK